MLPLASVPVVDLLPFAGDSAVAALPELAETPHIASEKVSVPMTASPTSTPAPAVLAQQSPVAPSEVAAMDSDSDESDDETLPRPETPGDSLH